MSNYDDRSPEEIETELRDTRENLSSTLNELQQRLAPKELMNKAAEQLVGEKGLVTSLKNSIRVNPLPYCLLGIGSSWLLASAVKTKNSDPSHRTSSRDTEDYQSILSSAMNDEEIVQEDRSQGAIQPAYSQQSQLSSSQATDQSNTESRMGNLNEPQMTVANQRKANATPLQVAKEKITSLAKNTQQVGHNLKENSRQLANNLKQKAKNSSQYVSVYADQNPLGLIAIGASLGVFLGAIIPPTRTEAQLLASAQEKLRVQPLQPQESMDLESMDLESMDYASMNQESERRETGETFRQEQESASTRLKNSPTDYSH